MKKITIIITALTLCFNVGNTQTNFGWETAVGSGSPDDLNTTETIDGITLTASCTDGILTTNFGDFLNTTANLANTDPTSLVTFSFDQPVVVNYILPIELSSVNVDYTFTPTPLGGANQPITVAMVANVAPDTWVDLNWINVTSFTVTASSPVAMGFDDLNVFAIEETLSTTSDFGVQKAVVFPNPVENILTIKNVSNLKSIEVYNSLGQQVLQSKEESIDVSHLSKGLYFLQINSSTGSETKKVIKK